jgi:histidinol-phosphate aminotransferase
MLSQNHSRSFAELIQVIGRPESLRHKSYSVPQSDGFARMHQNESYLADALGRGPELAQELADVLAREWSKQGCGPHVYPSLDLLRLRAAYARYLDVDTSCVEVFAGSSEALQTIAAGCFRPGARVAFFDPSFSILGDMVRFWGATCVPIPLKQDFSVDPLQLLSAEVLSADVVILCTPNNPTGVVTPPELVRDLVERAKGLVVVDEAYFEFAKVWDPGHEHHLQLAVERPNVVVLRTLSKAWGAAGLRVGALVGRPETVSFFAGLRHPYGVNAPSEILASHILDNKRNIMAELCQRAVDACRLWELQLRKRSGLKTVASKANFVFFEFEQARQLERACFHNKMLIRALNLQRRVAPDSAHEVSVHQGSYVRANPWDAAAQKRFVDLVDEVIKGAHDASG